jgi:NADH:ubiquinone oxidoreductase subunit 6 (subunit J)
MQNVDIVQWIAFVVLTLLTLGGAIMVVADRNLFHGALWLLVSLFGVAGFFVMLAAPFLAAVQVLVYMGAIVILIIFAIMLTQRMMGAREAVNNRWPIGLVMSALAFLLVSFILTLASNSPLLPNVNATGALQGDSIINFGKALVDPGQYALPFELASLLLTAAMIGAIVIAREDA